MWERAPGVTGLTMMQNLQLSKSLQWTPRPCYTGLIQYSDCVVSPAMIVTDCTMSSIFKHADTGAAKSRRRTCCRTMASAQTAYPPIGRLCKSFGR